MKIRTAISLLLFLAVTAQVLGQKVTNVQATVKNDKVLIGYQIKGLKCEQSVEAISFYVSKDGGNNYVGPLHQIDGDLEPGLRNGKHIVEWDAMKEMPFSEESMIFDVRVELKERRRKRAIMLSYVGNIKTPLGGRIGQLGKVSWYIEGRASLLVNQPTDYSYRGSSIEHDHESHSAEFTESKGWKAYSGIIGATFQTHCNLFLYLGLGYGFEEYIKEINVKDTDTGEEIGTYWAYDKDKSMQGIEIDGGVIFRYKKLIISGGVSAINLQNYNWSVGLGVAF